MKATVLLLLLIFSTLIPIFSVNEILLDETDYVNFLTSEIPSNQIEQALDFALKMKWVTYLLTVVFLLLKCIIVSSIIWLGMFLSNKKEVFLKVWKVSLLAQLVFAFKGYILLGKVIFSVDFSLKEIQKFHPLSLASLFDNGSIAPYWDFIFRSINLFEITYWLVLAHLISRLLDTDLNEGLKITLSSYVPAFGLWLLTVTFFLVSNF